jgi:hypothetical protein
MRHRNIYGTCTSFFLKKKRPANVLLSVNVISLHSNHWHVSATHMAISRSVRTRIQLQAQFVGFLTNYNSAVILVFTTLKMALRVVETCQLLLCNKLTFIRLSAFSGLFFKKVCIWWMEYIKFKYPPLLRHPYQISSRSFTLLL